MQLAAGPTAFVVIRRQNVERATAHLTVMPKHSAASMASRDNRIAPLECVARSSGKTSIRTLNEL